MTKDENSQPLINIGIVGHVDHGKTTLTKLLSGTWTDTSSLEKKRGITIKLGYTDFSIYKNNDEFSTIKKGEFLEKYSIVDSPGHASFMATMICGSAVMDYAILLISADEKCPQPQTIEHINALELSQVKKIIVIQNKIDLVSKEEAIKNYNSIKKFLETTKFKDSKIIPFSAFYGANLKFLLEEIYNDFEVPKRDLGGDVLFTIVRSFDVNKPGTNYKKLNGGIMGGSLKKGTLKVGDEIEIRPGRISQKDGKLSFEPIYTKIKELRSNKTKLDKIIPGGSVAISTYLDPILTKNDFLVGQVGGLKGKLPNEIYNLKLESKLFENSKNLIVGEIITLIVNSITTIGKILKVKNNQVEVILKKPIIAFEKDKLVIFRNIDNKEWKIIGHGILI